LLEGAIESGTESLIKRPIRDSVIEDTIDGEITRRAAIQNFEKVTITTTARCRENGPGVERGGFYD